MDNELLILELAKVINKHGCDTALDMPDFVIASRLAAILKCDKIEAFRESLTELLQANI